MAVRNEKVVLTVVDEATTPMARFAAATALANKELRDLSGTSAQASEDSEELSKSTEKVGDETEKTTKKTREYTLEMAVADEKSKRFKASLREQAAVLVDQETSLRSVTDEAERVGDAFRKGSSDIDRYSGRLRLISEAVTILGPGLIPLGAAGVPAVTALAAGLGAAGGALGVLLLGFNGLGDALDAIDTARLEPTTENLQAMRDELEKLGPAGADFAQYLSDLRPELENLQRIARKGMFPGFTDGIDDLLNRLPEVQHIIHELSRGLGDLGADAGAALAGDRFSAFFDYLETEARPTMEAFARSTGNVVEGLASLLVAFAPLTRDFTGGMESMSKSFADWAAGLSETDGFRDFTAYLRESGPQALALLGSLGNAFIAIAKAAAPVGAVVLPALTALARVLTLIANSPIGAPLFTAAAALIALNRAMSLGQAGFAKFGSGLDATTGGLTRMQKAAGAAGLALAGLAILDELQDGADRAAPGINALTNSLIEMANATGAVEAPESLDKLAEGIERLSDPNVAQGLQDNLSSALGGIGNDSLHDNAVKQIEALDQALTGLVNNQGPEAAAKALEGLGRSAGLSESEMADLVGLLPGYADAVAGATGATGNFSSSVRVTGRAAGLTGAELRGLTEAMEAQRASALGAFDAVTQYASALISARKQAEKSNAGIEISNDMTRKQKLAVIENREALSQLGAAWNNQGDAVRNNMGKWREARGEFIATAMAMGATAAQARRLANDVLEIPRQRVIDIRLYGSEKAADQIARIRNAVTSIPREWSTTYYVNQVNGLNKPKVLPGNPDGNGADGTTVPKTGLPYADRHPYMLADGEEVISNRHGQADRHRPLLKAINAGRLADGGTAGNGRRSTFDVAGGGDFGPMPRTVRDAVAALVDLRGSLRDLRGDIKDSAREIKRETKERDRLSAIVDKNQDALDTLNGLFQDLASAVKANLTSDQFANVPGIANENPWASSTASTEDRPPTVDEVIARLNQDSANASAMYAATNSLKEKGVSDDALKSILAQGLETSQMFAGLTPEKLKEYQDAFGIRTLSTDGAAAAAGGAVYGADIAAAEADLAESKADRREQTLAIREMTAEARMLNRTQERSEKQLERIKDHLGDLRDQIKKARGELESAARSQR